MPAPKSEEPEAAAPKSKKSEPDRSALYDELEQLKAEGNKNPDRLAEIKKLLA